MLLHSGQQQVRRRRSAGRGSLRSSAGTAADALCPFTARVPNCKTSEFSWLEQSTVSFPGWVLWKHGTVWVCTGWIPRDGLGAVGSWTCFYRSALGESPEKRLVPRTPQNEGACSKRGADVKCWLQSRHLLAGGIDGAEQPCMSCSRAAIDQSSGQPQNSPGLTAPQQARRKQPSLVAGAQKKADKKSIPLN